MTSTVQDLVRCPQCLGTGQDSASLHEVVQGFGFTREVRECPPRYDGTCEACGGTGKVTEDYVRKYEAAGWRVTQHIPPNAGSEARP